MRNYGFSRTPKDAKGSSMSTPDADKAIDIMVSRIYEVDNSANPLQRVLFGVKVVNGIPQPIIERRDANTGALIKSYLDGSKM